MLMEGKLVPRWHASQNLLWGGFLEYILCEQVMNFEFPQDTETVKGSCFYLHIQDFHKYL